MNKSIVTIATILSLGTIGCAGVGTQYAGTSSASRAASVQYVGGGLGTLWESNSSRSAGLEQQVAVRHVGADRWVPASVARVSEIDPRKDDPKARLGSTATKLKF